MPIDYSDFKALRLIAIRYAKFRGMGNEEYCEDFAQDYCLAVFRGEHKYLKYQFANFMRRLAGRNRKDAKIFTNKFRERLIYFELSTLRDVVDPCNDPPPDQFRKIEYKELREAIFDLTPNQLLVVSLFLRGFNQKEIADKLGKSEPSVSITLKKIYAKLRPKLC